MALEQLDIFMETMKMQESSGDYSAIGPVTKYGRALGAYQIVEDNWDNWSKEAYYEGYNQMSAQQRKNLPSLNWEDPKTQDRTAKNKFTQYYNKYKSWDLVAIAWFAGPGNANIVKRNTDLNPRLLPEDSKNLVDIMSYKDVLGKDVGGYVNDVMTNMNKELENKGMATATRYTAQDPSIRVQQPQMANSNVATSMIDALSQNTAGGQRQQLAVGGDQARQASNVRTAIDNAKAKGESTINVSMASEKNPYSARELGMKR